tara:strand:+ start:8652 stop:9137 length:486 start_codon:yes stop_codon:yes gene_type:complete
MKKLLFILLSVTMILSCNPVDSKYDKLIGYTYSNSELDKKLKKWEYYGGQLVENSESLERAITFYRKDNQRLVIAKKMIGRNGQQPIWEIIGSRIIILEENQTFMTNMALDGKVDEGIVAVVIYDYENWECTEIVKAWKLNIYSGEFEYIDVTYLSCYDPM